MTAPAAQDQQQRQRAARVRHRLCVIQAMAARYGLPRVTLCGKVKTGPQRDGTASTNLPPCPMCHTVEAEHRATCPACLEYLGGGKG